MAGDAIVGPLGRGDAALVDRFAAPGRRRGFWIALWVAAIAAELGVLVPVFRGTAEPVEVILRLVGGSFAACGLIAWHRRPDSRSGLLMTATGFAFLVPALFRDHDVPAAQTVAGWLSDLWTLFFVPLLLTFLTGGRLRTPSLA